MKLHLINKNKWFTRKKYKILNSQKEIENQLKNINNEYNNILKNNEILNEALLENKKVKNE